MTCLGALPGCNPFALRSYLDALRFNPIPNRPADLLADGNAVAIADLLKGPKKLLFKPEVGLLEWRHVYTRYPTAPQHVNRDLGKAGPLVAVPALLPGIYCAAMDDQPSSGQVSVSDLLRLKHHYNSRVTYGRFGLNAQEVGTLLKSDYSKWPDRWKTYDKNRREAVGMLSRPLVLGAAMVTAGVLYWLEGWFRTGGVALFAVAMYSGIKEVGHREGYFDGFEEGREETLIEVAGITAEDLSDVRERATEMEIDEMVIGRLDAKQDSTGRAK